jgi:beta-glucanase (GH16 family)
MKYLVTLFLILTSYPAFSQVGNLIWEDNFNGSVLDTSKWNCETGTGVNGDWGTGQLDRATERLENVSFQDGINGADSGCLLITTRHEFYIDRNYTSGRIRTAGKASWGPGHRLVARIFPRDVNYKGQGFAFWMMPDELPAGWSYIMWPQGGEIDIMEYVGSVPFHNLGGVHYAWSWENNQWQSWNHGHQGAYYSYHFEEVPDPSEPGYGGYPPLAGDPYAGSGGFHNYGIDWYDDRMEFFVDSTVYHIHYLNDGGAFQIDGQDGFTISNRAGKRAAISEYSNHFTQWHPFEHKMYFILSAGVGGSSNTYGGAIVPEAEFPCSVFIDWIRVYELNDITGFTEKTGHRGFNLFPNPAKGLLRFQIDNPGDYRVRITDMSGHVMVNTLLDETSSLDISNLGEGIYVVLISSGTITISRKIIIP